MADLRKRVLGFGMAVVLFIVLIVGSTGEAELVMNSSSNSGLICSY